ncbi:MAG: hypothetical protein KC425_15975, partial [Anaerolineales bacterium]|nr:hypothetical protein [Anaerolineales bacterium]
MIRPAVFNTNRLPPALRRLTPAAPVAALLALILLFFHQMAFSNLILARGDTFLYFYPYWDAAAEALRAGRLPLWNPYLFMGAPFLANSQVGLFYPPNWPLWLLFDAPTAVKASILLHLAIAGCGAYLAARQTLALGRDGALATAVTFALGGYLTAQVEHVNQLQGLAWLPWFLVVLGRCARERPLPRAVAIGRTATALAGLFALQLLAGHTQTAFITGVAVLLYGGGVWLAGYLTRRQAEGLPFRFAAQRVAQRLPLALLLGVGLAGVLAAVQLLPTQELAQLSARQGGLPANEVLSFSLHPLLLPRALLPGFGQSLFSEYVAFVPLTLLLLAFVGGWQWRGWHGVLPAVVLVAAGLLLALGIFNPLNWLLARLPGFNLFRVPARWLVLYALGVALLAGAGWQVAWAHFQMRARAAVDALADGPRPALARPLRLG